MIFSKLGNMIQNIDAMIYNSIRRSTFPSLYVVAGEASRCFEVGSKLHVKNHQIISKKPALGSPQ